MERLCARVQQQVCVLRGAKEKEEVQAAKQVLKEARNSRAVSESSDRVGWHFCHTRARTHAHTHRHTQRVLTFLFALQLYPSLCELAHVLSVDGPVRQKLDSLAGELAKAADKELQVGLTGSLRFQRRSTGSPIAVHRFR